ncbi:MAG: Bordetella virus [Planctomycetota bacterium]
MTARRIILVAYNEEGNRVGETHHNSTIPDLIVRAIRDLHEEEGLGYTLLSRRFGISRSAIAKICRYERRNQFPCRWRRVEVDEERQEDRPAT